MPPKKELLLIIDRLRRPFEFASKDDFAKLSSVKGLEDLVSSVTGDAKSLELPKVDEQGIDKLRELFKGFDSFKTSIKRDRISRAVEILDSIASTSKRGVTQNKTKPGTEFSTPLSKQASLSSKEDRSPLRSPLAALKGFGPKLSERFAKKGISSVEDLLYYLPKRYEDRSTIKKIRELTVGGNELASGEVLASGETRYGRRQVFEAALGDSSGILVLKWFNFRGPYMKKLYTVGRRAVVYGQVSSFGGKKEIIHPEVEFLDEGVGNSKEAEIPESEPPGPGIVPIYSEIEGLHQRTVRRLVRDAAMKYALKVAPGAPSNVTAKAGYMSLPEAIAAAHCVADRSLDQIQSRKSIVFDELFTLELGLALKRRGIGKEPGLALEAKPGGVYERLLSLLPYELTGAQERALEEVSKDMAEPHPMNRLLQGDVGSGKTVLCMLSAMRAVDNGYQAALMAPTEILAEQHYLSYRPYAEELGVELMLLTGGLTKAKRLEALKRVESGEVSVVVGTHALVQEDVAFPRLGLAVIDEQHRFGVVQRGALKKKGPKAIGDADIGEEVGAPDILVMTATPIPRTLAMTVFGDMDVSVIDELPPGRTPIKTTVLREKDRTKAYKMIREEIESGGQAYIIYPLVEESEELSLKDATNMKEHLAEDIFPDLRVALLHGRMKGAEKEAVMKAFKAGEIDILVATTVIEVGVDVPNASIILVEHAERFGLAQLHQLRGRVGRGKRKSRCVLLAQWTQSDDALKRLRVMEKTQDGFEIAEEDLKIRGPGDFLGTRQSGLPDFRLKETLSDLTILKKAREEALNFLATDPHLKSPEGSTARRVLEDRWAGRFELAQIG